MAEYAPPPGPPPPKAPNVPEGWKAVWNAQYSEWFYVNIYTKKSQWEKPTSPVYPPGEVPPDGPPPYSQGAGAGNAHGATNNNTNDQKLATNNPYANMSEDERLARRLQDEEDARFKPQSPGTTSGESTSYYNNSNNNNPYGAPPGGSSSLYPPSPQPRDRTSSGTGRTKSGLLGKILGAGSKHSSTTSQQHAYAPPSAQQYYPPQPQQYYAGGYGSPSPYQQQRPPMGMMGGGGRRPGGMGGMGAGALGLGGGLLAGGLLGSAMADHGGDTYIENNDYGDGGGGGGDYGGDGGGGDFGGDGGGDFGGDF